MQGDCLGVRWTIWFGIYLKANRYENGIVVSSPFAASLDTHKLKGTLSGLWACSVTYDCRIVFDFVESEEGEVLLLFDIGTHDEVY